MSQSNLFVLNTVHIYLYGRSQTHCKKNDAIKNKVVEVLNNI